MTFFFIITVQVYTLISGTYAEIEGGISCLNHTTGILAYLDPGTGSLIFQLLIASLVAGGFAIKIFWHQTKAFLARLFTKTSQKTITKENDQKK